MNSQQYIANAVRTESIPAYIEINQFGLHSALILLIAASNVADLVKRKIFYGKDVDAGKLKTECNALIAMSAFLANSIDSNPELINNIMPQNQVDGFDFTEASISKLNLGNLNIRLLHCALGIHSESGEMLEALLKQYETGELDNVNFAEEIGDVDWYKAIGHDETGVSEEELRIKNIAKLKKRYPEKFAIEKALNRDLLAERVELERPAILDMLNQANQQ